MSTERVVSDELIAEIVELYGPCRFDHHGYCQAHNLQPKDECWVARLQAARAAAPAHDNKSDVIERAQLWLDEAHRRGINVTDEDGYLAVIGDLVSEVEFQRTALQGYRNEQERLIDQCDRAWKEVDAIAKERDRATKA